MAGDLSTRPWTCRCSDTCAFIPVGGSGDEGKPVNYLAAAALFFWLDIQLTQVPIVGR